MKYKKTPPTGKGAHGKGYGHKHEQNRKRLIARMPPGEPCWWCGLPMHKQPQHNWDNKPLCADHTNKHGARNKEDANRLLHFTCNSQRQDGRNDHLRPAITGTHPQNPLQTKNPTHKTNTKPKHKIFTWA